MLAPAALVRARVAREVRAAFAAQGDEPQFTPSRDGLLGRRAVARRVHAELGPMMIGGVAALLTQMLHPAALAGVWDHSDWERSPHGRLRRTARFIAVTTYGERAEAETQIARVRRIHDRVTGVTADGTPYAANDAALLTWIHTTEAILFLAGHRRYADPWMGERDRDRYFAEMALVARALGAPDVPATHAAGLAYLEAMRPQLRYDARTRDMARALLTGTAPTGALGHVHTLLAQAAIDLIPAWARALHGFEAPPRAVRAAAAGMSGMLRWALAPA